MLRGRGQRRRGRERGERLDARMLSAAIIFDPLIGGRLYRMAKTLSMGNNSQAPKTDDVDRG